MLQLWQNESFQTYMASCRGSRYKLKRVDQVKGYLIYLAGYDWRWLLMILSMFNISMDCIRCDHRVIDNYDIKFKKPEKTTGQSYTMPPDSSQHTYLVDYELDIPAHEHGQVLSSERIMLATILGSNDLPNRMLRGGIEVKCFGSAMVHDAGTKDFYKVIYFYIMTYYSTTI